MCRGGSGDRGRLRRERRGEAKLHLPGQGQAGPLQGRELFLGRWTGGAEQSYKLAGPYGEAQPGGCSMSINLGLIMHITLMQTNKNTHTIINTTSGKHKVLPGTWCPLRPGS